MHSHKIMSNNNVKRVFFCAGKRKRLWKPWKGDQLEALKDFFNDEIGNNILPGKKRCGEFLEKTGVKKQWTSVKNCVRNIEKKRLN